MSVAFMALNGSSINRRSEFYYQNRARERMKQASYDILGCPTCDKKLKVDAALDQFCCRNYDVFGSFSGSNLRENANSHGASNFKKLAPVDPNSGIRILL